MEVLSTFDWNWNQVIVDLLRVLISLLLVLPIAWQRYSDTGPDIGFRTFPIVAVASCGYLLIAKHTPGANAETQARIIQGLLSGMGSAAGPSSEKGEMCEGWPLQPSCHFPEN